MTTPPQPPYQQPTGFITTPAPKKKSKLPWILGGVGAFLALCLGGVVLIGVTAEPDTKTPAKSSVAAEVKTDAPAAAEVPAEQPKAKTPVAKDFKLAVKVTRKKCFGSAGCNLDYRIEMTYAGDPLALAAGRSYEITYQVKGAEEEVIGTFEVTGDSYSTTEESTQTASSSKKLTAVATSVTEM